MHQNKAIHKIFLISILLILTLSSCSKYIGYGVVLLPGEENKLDSGTLIKITKESRIRKTWVYNTETEEHIEIDQWRVDFYEKEEHAQNYIDKSKEFKNYHVIVNRDSHSMRVKPVAGTQLVYRLKKGEKVKVIGRTKNKEEIGSFDGYWWELITEAGVKGWSYDSYLSVYNGDKLVHSNIKPDGPEIHDFFKTTWRPKSFYYMQRDRVVNLDIFKSKFKMTPDIDNKELTISMPDHYVTFNFTEFKRTGTNNYNLIGSPVQLDFSMKGTVTVIYSVDSKSYQTDFIYMSDSLVSEIINNERTTRKIKYNEFIFKGPIFNSNAYGEIIFNEDNTFEWKNRDNLINKQLITRNANPTGTVSFKLFLGSKIKTKYSGIITFDFGSRQEISFLYNFKDSGIQFLYIPPTKIKDNKVEDDDFYTPIQLFFTGSN